MTSCVQPASYYEQTTRLRALEIATSRGKGASHVEHAEQATEGLARARRAGRGPRPRSNRDRDRRSGQAERDLYEGDLHRRELQVRRDRAPDQHGESAEQWRSQLPAYVPRP